MLPAQLRYWLFDRLSVKTMRYVSAVPTGKAEGLTKQVYDMIREDFFKNGSLTSRSKVPELMAAIWTGGREAMLVADRVDRTTKDAIAAVLSQLTDCPYCEDMLVSLVHAGGEHEAAQDIFAQNGLETTDALLRERLEWVRAIATPGNDTFPPTPFDREQLPEVFGTLLGMSDINRFSHVVMEDSPVSAPFGVKAVKAGALRLFGAQLEATRHAPLKPGGRRCAGALGGDGGARNRQRRFPGRKACRRNVAGEMARRGHADEPVMGECRRRGARGR
jgi:AhpD family alkylhydroperoxidase